MTGAFAQRRSVADMISIPEAVLKQEGSRDQKLGRTTICQTEEGQTLGFAGHLNRGSPGAISVLLPF